MEAKRSPSAWRCNLHEVGLWNLNSSPATPSLGNWEAVGGVIAVIRNDHIVCIVSTEQKYANERHVTGRRRRRLRKRTHGQQAFCAGAHRCARQKCASR